MMDGVTNRWQELWFITLPIRIMNYMELTFDPTLAAISTLLILASLVLIVLMEKFVGLDMFVK